MDVFSTVKKSNGSSSSSSSSSSNTGFRQKIQQFGNLTAEPDESIAQTFLDQHDYNVEAAVGAYYDAQMMAQHQNQQAAYAAALPDGGDGLDADQRRAPLQQQQAQLINHGAAVMYPHGSRIGHHTAEAHKRSLFKSKSGKKNLNGLFAPPTQVMFEGSYAEARAASRNVEKWLLVNIQELEDFHCMCLTRDVWNNEAVQEFIRENFIFWQRSHKSPEGAEYCRNHVVTEFPHVGIIDPLTKAKFREWNREYWMNKLPCDPVAFIEGCQDFLREHSLTYLAATTSSKSSSSSSSTVSLPSSSSSSSSSSLLPSSLANLTEEEQLKLALQASMKESGGEIPDAVYAGKCERGAVIINSDGEEEALDEVWGYDSDEDKKQDDVTSSVPVIGSKRKASSQEQDAMARILNGNAKRAKSLKQGGSQATPVEIVSSSSSDGEKEEEEMEELSKNAPRASSPRPVAKEASGAFQDEDIAADAEDATTIQFRFPGGRKGRKVFRRTHSLAHVYAYIRREMDDSQTQYEPEEMNSFVLVSSHPRRTLERSKDITIADADAGNSMFSIELP